MAAAPTKSKPTRTRAKNGQKAEGGRMSREPVAILPPPPQSPIAFALSVMRDDSKPDSLRASMARAAMPYLHARGEAKEEKEEKAPQEEWSDLELARRIAHILGLGEAEGMRELEDARASAKIAEEKARAAEARARELEQRTLAAEAMIARRKESRQDSQGSHTSPLDSASHRRDETAGIEQLAAAEERARAAEVRTREAEAHALEMQQRAFAAEELIAERRERRGRF